MKHGIITITIESGSRNDIETSRASLMKIIRETTLRLNGSKIRQSYTNGDDASEVQGLMGQLKWWTLQRPSVVPDGKPRGFWNRLAKEVGSIFTEDDGE